MTLLDFYIAGFFIVLIPLLIFDTIYAPDEFRSFWPLAVFIAVFWPLCLLVLLWNFITEPIDL